MMGGGYLDAPPCLSVAFFFFSNFVMCVYAALADFRNYRFLCVLRLLLLKQLSLHNCAPRITKIIIVFALPGLARAAIQ